LARLPFISTSEYLADDGEILGLAQGYQSH
jgi:hypothetical protein